MRGCRSPAAPGRGRRGVSRTGRTHEQLWTKSGRHRTPLPVKQTGGSPVDHTPLYQCTNWSRRRLQSKSGHGAHDLVYAQPLVTLTWSTRTPTSSWCTYEQKDDGDGGVTKGLHRPARSGDAPSVRSAAAHDASRASRRDAIFHTFYPSELCLTNQARYRPEKRGTKLGRTASTLPSSRSRAQSSS